VRLAHAVEIQCAKKSLAVEGNDRTISLGAVGAFHSGRTCAHGLEFGVKALAELAIFAGVSGSGAWVFQLAVLASFSGWTLFQRGSCSDRQQRK